MMTKNVFKCSVFNLSPTHSMGNISRYLSVRVVVHGGVGERGAYES